jgi:Nif-specific regulatory protein
MSSRAKKSREKARDPLADLSEIKRFRAAPTPPPVPPTPSTAPDPEGQRYRDLLAVAMSLTTLELKAILDAIVDGIMRVTGCERGFLMLREEDGSFSMFIGRTRDHKPWGERDARQISNTIVGRVLDTHEPFIGSDLEKMDDLLSSGSILAQKIRSAVCLPLLYKERLIGVIYADSGFVIPQFLEADTSLLRAFGAQAALAIENARQHGEIRDRGDRLEEQNLKLRHQLAREFAMLGMVSKNKRMQEVFATVEKIAPSDISSVLIEGESGTGKELLARAIHDKGPRRGRPFEAVNCASIPEGLVESILFGHRKGAFTGADFDKAGVFEVANGGTLFLDEVADMPLDIQPKLLRALQEREVTRVGEEGRTRKVDVQIVAATNQDLARAVAEKAFREDLYYRLKVARIQLPPLRERREDIIPLAEYFLASYAEERGQPPAQLSREARAILLASPWVGNVRELKNAMELGTAFQDDNHVIHGREIERFFSTQDRSWASPAGVDGSLHEQLDQVEAQIIRQALARNDSNVSSAAKALGISRQQLHLKIKKYGISTRSE